MKFRHEWKHQIDQMDLHMIRQSLRAVARADEHAQDGKYLIRSLYFDDLYDKALREKVDGVDKREKFRIRFYNLDPSVVHLEKKSKIADLTSKASAPLTAEEAARIVEGDLSWMADADRPLVQELYRSMLRGLRPKVIVDYEREPFVYGPGNVRVTFDYHIRTGLKCVDFLDPRCVTVPVPDDPIILEVKWDEFLPSIIRDAVQVKNRHQTAFSKYAACRMYD